MKQAMSRRLLGAGLMALMVSPALSAPGDPVYEPKRGSRERKAIFNAMRAAHGKEKGQPVIFQGDLKASKSGWAFFSGGALIDDGKGGRPINNEGAGALQALLRLRNGKWRVLDLGYYGGMDGIEDALKKYPQAPRALFR